MQTRYLIQLDTFQYEEDLIKCVKDNPQICDYQSLLDIHNDDSILNAISSYINCMDSSIEGIFDDNYEYLFGFIAYDKIRLTDDGNSAEVHICISKDMWGRDFYPVYEEILKNSMFDVLYADMPACCRGAITLCKRLGFKKTGYIPKSIPYVTTKGDVKMFDEYIYSWENTNKKRPDLSKEEIPF